MVKMFIIRHWYFTLVYMAGYLDIVKYLSCTCNCDLTIEGVDGDTALSIAQSRGHNHIAKFI